jgi:hypothetical protein
MANMWFVQRGDKKTGPVDSAELKQLASTGRLLPTDLVQREGGQDWVPAARIKGLFAAPTGKPPQLPATHNDAGGVNLPPVVSPQPSPPLNQDPTGGLIPVNNPQALIAYYTGIFLSPCCLVGLPLGLVPLVFGIRGLRARKRNPEIKGSVHAWIGVILGGLSTVSTLVLWGAVAWSMLNQR